MLDRSQGNKREACRVLDISYHTLQAYLRFPWQEEITAPMPVMEHTRVERTVMGQTVMEPTGAEQTVMEPTGVEQTGAEQSVV